MTKKIKFKECNKQFCSLEKMRKKSYSNTAVVFVLLGFYFFLVFFEFSLNKQPAAAVLLRYIIYVVVA